MKSEMAYKPLGEMILVQPAKEPDKTSTGLFVPPTQGRKNQFGGMPPLCRGVVLAVGPGKVSPEGNVLPMTVKPGDNIIYAVKGASPVPQTVDEASKSQPLVLMPLEAVFSLEVVAWSRTEKSTAR